MTDILVGVPCIFDGSFLSPLGLTLVCRGDVFSCVTKSFLYSGLLTAVRMVGHTLLWCVAG